MSEKRKCHSNVIEGNKKIQYKYLTKKNQDNEEKVIAKPTQPNTLDFRGSEDVIDHLRKMLQTNSNITTRECSICQWVEKINIFTECMLCDNLICSGCANKDGASLCDECDDIVCSTCSRILEKDDEECLEKCTTCEKKCCRLCIMKCGDSEVWCSVCAFKNEPLYCVNSETHKTLYDKQRYNMKSPEESLPLHDNTKKMSFSINVSRVSAKRTTHFQISHNIVAKPFDDASALYNQASTVNGAVPIDAGRSQEMK
jgi:hypothetical protein